MPQKTKSTIARDSVFRSSAGQQTVSQGIPPSPAEPLVVDGLQTEPPRQTGVWLTNEDLEWLDNCRREIRSGGWRGVTRSALIRAIIQTMSTKSISLSGVSSEAELLGALERALAVEKLPD